MSDTTTSERLLYRVPEAAGVLGLGQTTVKALIASGELRSVKIRGARRVSATALADYVAGLDGL
ncbi:MAG TPA: helix-turn-helix domain-containing protein [Acidimicrobiales bacterium]|nr:helix-turn-helix domain-containing protein [Acidimicrobiales bacterium]